MMKKGLTTIAILMLIVASAAGCRTMTGRTFGQNIDDATTTASVKTKLTADSLQNLTWVDVDTRDGIVYLQGTAQSEEQKRRAGEVAAGVSGVTRVVNNIHVRPEGTTTASGGTSATTATASAPSAAPAAFLGRHTMTGEVTEIDATRGHVSVRTSEREMELHFPPSALQNLQKGDRVTVELGIAPLR